MGRGVFFVPCALRGAFVAVLAGVVAVRPTILRGFVAPDIFGDVLAVELSVFGVVVAVVDVVASPRWLVTLAVPVVVFVIIVNTAPAAPVAIIVVSLVLLGRLLLLMLP